MRRGACCLEPRCGSNGPRVHVGDVTPIFRGFTGGAAAQDAPEEGAAVDTAAPPSATPSAAQDASEQGAAVDAAAPPSVMPSTEEAEDVLAAVAASGGSDRRSGSAEREDHGEGGGEQDSSGGPPEVDTMETDEQDAGEELAEAQTEEQGEASEVPAAADDAADDTAAEVAPTADEEAEVAPKAHTDEQGGAARAENQENDNADTPAEVLHTVPREPVATPAASAAASDSGGASKGSGGGAGKGMPLAVDLASLGKGGGLMGDDDEVFAPQVALAPSLSQYTAKAKEASGKVELNKYDIEAWKVLISEVQTGAMKHLAGEIYERVLQVFPTSGRHWLSYANTFVAENRKPKAIGVLQRALQHCPHVDLWRAFLIHFVGLTKDHAEIAKAYERAVECIGQDIAANAVWSDYIAFLKSAKAGNQYEKSMNMNKLRKAYQRALLVPMHQMEHIYIYIYMCVCVCV